MGGSFHGFNWDASKNCQKGIQKITLVGGFNPISKKYIANLGISSPIIGTHIENLWSFHRSPTRNQTIPLFRRHFLRWPPWPRRSSRWQGSLVRVMRLMRRLGCWFTISYCHSMYLYMFHIPFFAYGFLSLFQCAILENPIFQWSVNHKCTQNTWKRCVHDQFNQGTQRRHSAPPLGWWVPWSSILLRQPLWSFPSGSPPPTTPGCRG